MTVYYVPLMINIHLISHYREANIVSVVVCVMYSGASKGLLPEKISEYVYTPD